MNEQRRMTNRQRPTTNGQRLKTPGFATRAIHDGQEPDPSTGAVAVPIYATSTYVQEELGKHKGYEYARVSNPTRDRLEQNLASLEGGVASRVFASGMAAINAICAMYKSGDHIVCGHNLYGGVPRPGQPHAEEPCVFQFLKERVRQAPLPFRFRGV